MRRQFKHFRTQLVIWASTVVSQFQVFMDKNNKSIGEKKSDRSAKYKNLHAGHVNEMAEMCGRDANDAEGNKSINTEQLASITINDWDNSLLPNITIASCDSEPIGNKGQNMQTIDKLHAVLMMNLFKLRLWVMIIHMPR